MKYGATSTLGKAAAAVCAVACCALALPAQAQSSDGQNQPPQRKEGRRDFRDSRWNDNRDQRAFESRAEDQRRLMEENSRDAEMSRRMGRMSPDERRDLRRQINEAGQQVYSLPPRR